MSKAKTVRVAVVQASATPFRRDAAVDKVCALTADAAEGGAKLVLLPEAYVGGYPWGLTFGTTVGGRSEAGRRVWERYWSNAIEVPGPEVERMGSAAKEAGVHLCVGVWNETAPTAGARSSARCCTWDFRFARPGWPLYTPKGSAAHETLVRHSIVPLPEAVSLARAAVRATEGPAFRALRRHRSQRVSVRSPGGRVARAARQPAGTGSAQIRRNMSPNSRRVRCPSASRSQ